MAKAKMFRCTNASCDLGSRKDEGLFTGGITPEYALILTGDPEAPHGEGICPNCGEKGKAAGTFAPEVGKDPHEKLHRQIAERVADEHDPLSPEEAQAELRKLIGEEAS